MKHKKVFLFWAAVTLIALLTNGLHLNSGAFLQNLQSGLKELVIENYVLSAILYLAFTAAACVLLALPGVTFAVIAGMLFGPWAGSFFCLLGTTVGAVLSFIAGRYFLKDTVRPLVVKNKALSRLLFTDKPENEMILLMITRLLPVFPFNLQNFAYGITDIGLAKYSLGTFLFMIPGVGIFTFGAAGLIDSGERPRLFGAATAIAAAAGVLTILVKRFYKKRYAKEEGLNGS